MSAGEQRRHATEALAVGGGMVGASAAANYGMERALERKGIKTPARSLLSRRPRLHPAHGPFMAGRSVTAATRTVGIPLAAYGAFNVLSPSDKVARVRLKDDVVRPTINTATGRAQAKKVKRQLSENKAARKRAQAAPVTKSDLTDSERDELLRRKSKGSRLSLAAGTMGVAALGLRAPEVARAARKLPKVGGLKALKQMASREQGATKASNALGVAAIGTGSIGSFNYAAQQKLERKQVTKSLPSEGVIRGLGKVRVLGQHKKDHFMVMDSRDTKRLVHRDRVTFTSGKKKPDSGTQLKLFKALVAEVSKELTPEKKAAAKARARRNGRPYPNAYDNMIAGGAKFEKADDRFLRQHSDRISPQAEEGYRYLREGRNNALKDVAKDPRHAILHGQKAVRWNKKMSKIRAKGYERASNGEFGEGRDVEKALIPMRGPRLPRMRKPALRRSFIQTSPTGTQYTVRGTTR